MNNTFTVNSLVAINTTMTNEMMLCVFTDIIHVLLKIRGTYRFKRLGVVFCFERN